MFNRKKLAAQQKANQELFTIANRAVFCLSQIVEGSCFAGNDVKYLQKYAGERETDLKKELEKFSEPDTHPKFIKNRYND